MIWREDYSDVYAGGINAGGCADRSYPRAELSRLETGFVVGLGVVTRGSGLCGMMNAGVRIVRGRARMGGIIFDAGGLGGRCRGRFQEAGVKTHGEKALLLLAREIDQFTKLADDGLGGRVIAFGGLNGKLMLAVAETHDLDESASGLRSAPIGTHLLVNLEMSTTQAKQGLAKSAQNAGVFDPFVARNDVAVGLKKHGTLSQRLESHPSDIGIGLVF